MVVVDSSVIALSTHSLTCFVNLSDFMTAGLLKVNKTKTINSTPNKEVFAETNPDLNPKETLVHVSQVHWFRLALLFNLKVVVEIKIPEATYKVHKH